MNGDDVRDVRFPSGAGYDMSQVDGLLRRIAAELDAGRPAGPLITSATFRLGRVGYQIDTVDWFLDQLRCGADVPQSAGMGADAWRDLPVVNLFTQAGPGLPHECAGAWRDFGQVPGTRLRRVRRELRTADQQTIASVTGFLSATICAGERNFTFKELNLARSSSPGIAEIAARSYWDHCGHFAAKTAIGRKQLAVARLSALVDETGMPVLYVSGVNFHYRSWACISFHDQRWLRFLVRGTKRANAIMTAVDQAGNRVARYRIVSDGWRAKLLSGPSVEIIVHPDWELSNELMLAITISARWLDSYFTTGDGQQRPI